MKNGGMWCRDEVSRVCGCGGVDRGRYTAQRQQTVDWRPPCRQISQSNCPPPRLHLFICERMNTE